MTRDEAVARIQDGLGFNTALAVKIQARLREAQRDLERGKTLPRFLLVEFGTLALLANEISANLPARFLRIDDTNLPHYQVLPTDPVVYIPVITDLNEAVPRLFSTEPGAPPAMYLRQSSVFFFRPADMNYTLGWNYYQGGVVLHSNFENAWLNEETGAPEWLIGEAGYRIAMDARDSDAMKLFDDMRTRARAATFGEEIARIEAIGPLYMSGG